ncbi:plasmodesmata callose-binding protein 1 [Ananas comosus]|uniref:Plasmodesmata callose-binding protein 1 n=1 Tax=Ananas comosus TaxID=4615 RepID=A0A199VHN8_ANACO|nr:plasmodesmata callose-binding protein 1 [Ananas comosus]
MVSSSVLAAENWLRTHVLSHFPSKNITTIVVGRGILCNRGREHLWGLITPSVKSLHYSVVRWGLEKEIKVGADFSECLRNPALLSSFELKPLLSLLLQDANFVCLVSSSQLEVVERLGFYRNGNIRVMKEPKPIRRKLYSLRFGSNPFGFEAYGRRHKPPSFPFPPPPALAPNSPPEAFPVPVPVPANPPDVFPVPPMPPCLAAPTVAPPPGSGEEGMGGLWCVAKPTVPEEKLQEAMDYACGEGGADCEEIKPNGSCYYPDNVVAHASYAFNSYWQMTKQRGGSCGFDGTALLVNTDPSIISFAL